MKRYGGCVQITPDALLSILGLKGQLRGASFNYLGNTVDLIIEGGLGEYPEVPEGTQPQNLIVKVQKDGVKPVPMYNEAVAKVSLVDKDGNEYLQYDREVDGDGKANKEKEERGFFRR